MTRLRAAGPEAAVVMASLHAACFDRPWNPQTIADLAVSPGAALLGVWDEEKALGFILVRAIAGEAEILTLAVAPAARRQGIARALVEAAASASAGAGADVLWLEVDVGNATAVRLYEQTGFEVAGRRPGYYSRGQGPASDALVMRRPLNSVPS